MTHPERTNSDMQDSYTIAGVPESQRRSPAWVNWALVLVVLGGMFLVFGIGRPLLNRLTFRDPLAHPAVGSPMYRVELTGLVGTDASISQDELQGQVVLINFWATWCGPCRAEMPHIVQIGRDFGGQEGFRLLSVSHGAASTPDEMAVLQQQTTVFLVENGIEMPIYCDPNGTTLNVIDELAILRGASGPSGVPTTVAIDRKGIVRAVWVGFVPDIGIEEQMRATIADLLQEPAETPTETAPAET